MPFFYGKCFFTVFVSVFSFFQSSIFVVAFLVYDLIVQVTTPLQGKRNTLWPHVIKSTVTCFVGVKFFNFLLIQAQKLFFGR